jgi:hypothetical protein
MDRLGRDRGPIARLGLAATIDDRAADALRGEGINVIRDIPGHGIVLGGMRTVGGPDDWKYVPFAAGPSSWRRALSQGPSG